MASLGAVILLNGLFGETTTEGICTICARTMGEPGVLIRYTTFAGIILAAMSRFYTSITQDIYGHPRGCLERNGRNGHRSSSGKLTTEWYATEAEVEQVRKYCAGLLHGVRNQETHDADAA